MFIITFKIHQHVATSLLLHNLPLFQVTYGRILELVRTWKKENNR